MGVEAFEQPLSDKQTQSIRDACARVNVWEGSIRSGKTIASLLRWLIYCGSAPYGGELVVIGRTRDSVARNVFGPLKDPALFGPLARYVSYTAGASSGRILERTVHVFGVSDAKAEPTIRGLTVAGAYADELTVIREEFFTQLLGRMSVPGAQLFATTNPDNPAHWLKKKFLDRLGELPDWRHFHFTLGDNPSLTAAYVESISREYTGLWYRRFILGEWVAAEGAIYDMWDEARHVVPWESLPRMHRLLACGVDFGTTNPTAALILGIAHEYDDRGRRTGSGLYLVDEWRHDPSQQHTRLTNEQLSAGLRDWLRSPHLPYSTPLQPEWVFVDPAAASFSVQLQADGVPNVRPADNAVSYGIGTMASLYSAGKLAVSTHCPGLIGETPGYSWDPKATEHGDDKPVKVADHSLDAARYAITTTESVWRPLIGRTL